MALGDRVLGELSRVVVGARRELLMLLTTLLAGGHALLVGPPGVAKTLMAKSVARVLGLSVARVQFVPDLLPSDITGSYMIVGGRPVFRRGPLFADLVLVDEINRASPRVQAALLEAMQERQVTVWGETHRLPEAFTVVATMNPLESEGVYPLSEAQVDRFMASIEITAPGPRELEEVVKRHSRLEEPFPENIVSREEFLEERRRADRVHLDDKIARYIARIVHAIGQEGHLQLPLSPRAALSIARLSKAHAHLSGRDYVAPEDVKAVAGNALLHRIVLTPQAEAQGVEPHHLVEKALRETRPP